MTREEGEQRTRRKKKKKNKRKKKEKKTSPPQIPTLGLDDPSPPRAEKPKIRHREGTGARPEKKRRKTKRKKKKKEKNLEDGRQESFRPPALWWPSSVAETLAETALQPAA
jgi:hypothetical protein